MYQDAAFCMSIVPSKSVCSATVYTDKVALPAFVHLLLQQSIDSSCWLGPQQQTCSSGFAAVGPCWDRQTDGPFGWTLYHFIDPAPHNM